MELEGRDRVSGAGKRFAYIFMVVCLLGLVVASALEAVRPLCGGRRATIAANDRAIHGTRGPDVITAGPGPNMIHSGGGNDVICGGHGRDRIYGGRGKDTIDGKKDADFVHGGRGSDEVDGGAARDRVFGDSGNDAVRGGPGDRDEVNGGFGDDMVEGGRGRRDVLVGGVGRDRVDGGPGEDDIASYMSAGGPVAVDLVNGTVSGAEEERLVGVEDVLLAPGTSPGGVGIRVEVGRGAPGSSLAITGGDGADAAAIGFSRSGYVVTPGSGSPVLVEGGGVSSINVSLGAGDDVAAFDRSLPPGVSVAIDGGQGSDWLRGGPGGDTLYAGDDEAPDWLEGGGGDDALFGVNILHPRHPSGAATMLGGGGNDLMVGGQPCDGDFFNGGPGENDSASFSRVRNEGTFVEAAVGGPVVDPDEPACAAGRVSRSTEKIEGSTGPDVLVGSARDNMLLGRGGSDLLDGRGGQDRCIGGNGEDDDRHCEYVR
jgi:Ca2+-binding RTX toxin-like protein